MLIYNLLYLTMGYIYTVGMRRLHKFHFKCGLFCYLRQSMVAFTNYHLQGLKSNLPIFCGLGMAPRMFWIGCFLARDTFYICQFLRGGLASPPVAHASPSVNIDLLPLRQMPWKKICLNICCHRERRTLVFFINFVGSRTRNVRLGNHRLHSE